MNEDEIEHVVIYGSYKYEHQYIPNILRIDKCEFPHHQYIKTIDAGEGRAHILQGPNDYFLCLSKNECVSTEERIMKPLGFRRDSIEKLQAIADKFNTAKEIKLSKNRPVRLNPLYRKVVEIPTFDITQPWQDRMQNHFLINVETKEEMDLSQYKNDISKKCNITLHLLTCILNFGIVGKNWCYKGNRVDKMTWEEYFISKNVNSINQQTP